MKVMNVNGKIVLDKWYTCHHWCQNVISVGRRPLTILVNNAFTNMPPSEKKWTCFHYVHWRVTDVIQNCSGWELLDLGSYFGLKWIIPFKKTF